MPRPVPPITLHRDCNMASSDPWADVFREVASFVRLAGGMEERGDYSSADNIVDRLDRYIRIVYAVLTRLRTRMSAADADVEELISDVDGLLSSLQASFACSLYLSVPAICESAV